MGQPDRRCGIYFDKLERWQDVARALRGVLLDSPLDEAFKWRSPVYTLGKANVCNIGVAKPYCAIGFFKGVLMQDPEGLLVAPGANSRVIRMAKFTTAEEVAAQSGTLGHLIAEAVRLEEVGAKIDLPKDDFSYPDELRQQMAQDAELKRAFEALTPGRQRGWVLHFAQPKQSKTRLSRIEKARGRILDGKGMHDR
ncbi:YdeI/OmpD-associated family protein [Sulfitobacter sp. D35]|uniref:YdeI/OmpD-associated family protein n=1 Tax=Sulfitobacter sp. D35 TaxID=3083252 RepID=UPI00296F3490|nr:YdeI/OmpD-associated family protein [Sulfitobacter sp. D35]MDW4497385.1 YdeI/OmpD-associated family protein [Sulfitobacter sp. D35]